MDPQQSPTNPSQSQPQGPQVYPAANIGQVVTGSGKKSRALLIVSITSGLIITVLTILLVAVASSKKPAPKTATQDAQPQSTINSARPAQAIDVEQANDSISQDISGANDDNDLAPAQLEDKTLGL